MKKKSFVLPVVLPALALLLCGSRHPLHGAAAQLDVTVFSAGSWISGTPFDDAWYFNSLNMDGYGTIGPVDGFFHLPLSWTVESQGAGTRHHVAFGDAVVWGGYSFQSIQARLGMSIPLGYATNKAWIGPGAFKAAAGIASSNQWYTGGASFLSWEVMGYLLVHKGGSGARGGSWEIIPLAKWLTALGEDMRGGIEFLGVAKRYNWGTFSELAFTGVPHVVFDYFFDPQTFISLKAGFGPEVKRLSTNDYFEYTSNAFNLSAALVMYP